MKVVILCGGQGTRLREETDRKPKPMVEIGARPLLWHVMKIYAHYGFTDFVLCLGYLGFRIKDYFLNYAAMNSDVTVTLGRGGGLEFHDSHDECGWRITLADTGQDALTGARVKRVQKYIGNERFFLTYGDGVSDIDIRALLAFHEREGRIGTVSGVRPAGRFGELVLEDNKVTSFLEKPEMVGGYVNGGFFVFEPTFFDYLSDADSCILERAPLEKLAMAGQLSVYRHAKFWACVDTYRDFTALNDLWASGDVPWRVWR